MGRKKLLAVLAAALLAVQARELLGATAGPVEEAVVERVLDVVEDGVALAQGDAPLQPLVARVGGGAGGGGA